MNVFRYLARKSPVLLVLACLAIPVQAEAADWVYMDLGDVIVSGNPTDGYTYVPGALDFMKNLRDAGLKLALMSNIPESFGVTCQLKLTTLQQFLGSRLNEPEAFDWLLLDTVVLPPFDRYRKPNQFMFLHGLHNACPGRALFIGEDPGEVAVARSLGMATFHKDLGVDLPNVATIQARLDSDYTFEHPAACGFDSLYAEILLPADVGNVTGCAALP